MRQQCVEIQQNLMNDLDVFNSRLIAQNTALKFPNNNKKVIYAKSCLVTEVTVSIVVF